MVLYTDSPLSYGDVAIGEPNITLIQRILCDPQRTEEFAEWLEWFKQGIVSPQIVYFGIFYKNLSVGSIFLHDINHLLNEALIGYHIFEETHRGKGIGFQALTSLIKYTETHTSLKKLIIITAQTNIAAQRIAEKCKFTLKGRAHENPDHVVLTRTFELPSGWLRLEPF